MKSKVMFMFSSLLLVTSIFTLSSYSVDADNDCYILNNNDICITEEHYNNLINLGFTDFEIQNMDSEIFEENKDLEGQVVSSITNYYIDTNYYLNGQVTSISNQVTEEEYENFIPLEGMMGSIGNVNGILSYSGYTETVGKRMTTTIINNGSYKRYKNTVEWKNIPVTRSYDIIGIGLEDEKVHYVANRKLRQTYCTSVTDCSVGVTATFKNMETGVGAVYKLPTGTYVEMSVYMYFDVDKRSGVGTLTELYAWGDYSHATSSVTQSQATSGYTIGSGGIYIEADLSSSYDAINKATAYWSGTW